MTEIMEKIVENPNLIQFDVEDIYLPQVSIKVGDKTVKFDREKIKTFFEVRREQMKTAIIDIIRSKLEERFSNIIKDKPQEMYLPKKFATKGNLMAAFLLKKLHSQVETQLMEAWIQGQFCLKPTPLLDPECSTGTEVVQERRPISEEDFKRSMDELNLMLMEKKANLVVSASENYLNQLILKAVEGGLFKLGDQSFSLGKEKAFILAEEKGEAFNLYIDIIHKLSRTQRVLVGRTELNFPVRLSIGLKILLVDGKPRLQIKVREIKTDEKLLVEGLPHLGLKTNVDSVRFRSKVVESILKDLRPMDQKVLVDVELDEFKGTSLEQMSFISDGRGRANAVLSLQGLDF
jgi:hypothetical protein